MKVFMNKRSGKYEGGMILVAANNAKEAHEVFHSDARFAYYWDEFDGKTYDRYYELKDWKQIDGMEYDTKYPCVIDEDGYSD